VVVLVQVLVKVDLAEVQVHTQIIQGVAPVEAILEVRLLITVLILKAVEADPIIQEQIKLIYKE
jgi:hypothetical protein